MKLVILLRGAPGSEKSSYLANHYPDAFVCKARELLQELKKQHPCVATIRLLQESHNECYRRYRHALEVNISQVAVDNGNYKAWELAPYVIEARVAGYTVVVYRFKSDPKKAAARKNGRISVEEIEEIERSIEALPAIWNIEELVIEERPTSTLKA